MNDWKIYENGGLSAGCELKLFGRGGDSFFHGGCCVWCVVAFVEVVDSKRENPARLESKFSFLIHMYRVLKVLLLYQCI